MVDSWECDVNASTSVYFPYFHSPPLYFFVSVYIYIYIYIHILGPRLTHLFPPRVACSEQRPHSANQETGLSVQCLQTETQSHTIRPARYDRIYTLSLLYIYQLLSLCVGEKDSHRTLLHSRNCTVIF